MSLVIDAIEKLTGSGTVIATGATGATMILRVKRSTNSGDYHDMFWATDDASYYNGMLAGLNSASWGRGSIKGGNTEAYVDGAFSGSDTTTAWQFLALRFVGGTPGKVSHGVEGGSLTHYTLSGNNTGAIFSDNIDLIEIGAIANAVFRGKLAHAALYNDDLTDAQLLELFNGGSGGAGKNPQAVANANLTFYAPLTSDATVTIGGITLSETGSPTYDGADNPNVEAYGGGSVDGTATGATLAGTSSLTAGGASGSASGAGSGANLTGTSVLTAGSATGNATGSFATQAMENNSGAGLLVSTPVSWTWYEGAIGAAPTSTTHGTGTTNGYGILTVPGLPVASGFLLVRTSDSSGVYYESGTPA